MNTVNYKKTIMLLSISIITLIIATAGVTYAYISTTGVQTTANVLNSACFKLSATGTSKINYIGYPMSKETAFKKTPYSLTITNTCTDVINTSYKVVLNVLNTTSDTLLPYIYYSTDKSTAYKVTTTPYTLPSYLTKGSNVKSSYVIASGTLSSTKKTATHNLYLWIDSTATNSVMGAKFEAQVSVYSEAT